MKIYTSYFYQIRNFTRNMIPLSTAKWDPKWFQKGTPYKDKNGVYNGLRATPFIPGDECDGLCRGPEGCNPPNPNDCAFLKQYYKQLCKLDMSDILERFERIGNYIQELEKFEEEPVLVLIFYEVPKNLCSERTMVHKWFAEMGHPIAELEYPIQK